MTDIWKYCSSITSSNLGSLIFVELGQKVVIVYILLSRVDIDFQITVRIDQLHFFQYTSISGPSRYIPLFILYLIHLVHIPQSQIRWAMYSVLAQQMRVEYFMQHFYCHCHILEKTHGWIYPFVVDGSKDLVRALSEKGSVRERCHHIFRNFAMQ